MLDFSENGDRVAFSGGAWEWVLLLISGRWCGYRGLMETSPGSVEQNGSYGRLKICSNLTFDQL